MSSNIEIVAIGGNIEDRKLRCAAAKEIAPGFDHCYLSAGSPQNFPIKTNKALLDYKNKKVTELKKLNCGPNDTVVIIGQTNFNPREFSELIEGIDPSASVLLQGPGFNMIPPNLSSFSETHENIVAIPATACPSYPLSSIQGLIETYKGVGCMTSLQKSALAQFWLTRYDGSFYRQFGLANIGREPMKTLELTVASMFADQVKDLGDDGLNETANTIFVSLSVSLDFEFTKDKQGTEYPSGAFTAWKRLMELSSFKDGDKALVWLNKLSDILFHVMKTYENVEIKEYDGFVMSTLLNKNTSPKREEHLKNMFNAMTLGKVPEVFSETLERITKKGKLWVLHDLGMDPVCDDGIALKILYSASGNGKSRCSVS